MTPFPFEDAPAHVKKACPGKDTKWKTQPPECQVCKRVEMGTPRPLQIPGQVGVTFRLDTLFLDIRDPLRVESNPIKGIRLENAEGNNRCNSSRDQANEDQS